SLSNPINTGEKGIEKWEERFEEMNLTGGKEGGGGKKEKMMHMKGEIKKKKSLKIGFDMYRWNVIP
uniref:Ovule protein n=1 Tax=Loa loa TaxID=7209 RepID=A0A1I7VJB5_LOALO